jgi:hypothetical protein
MKHPDRKDDAEEVDLENPLGIHGETIAREASDMHASNDPESVRRRRARAGIGHQVEERRTSGIGDLVGDENDGMSGIDMGYGGDGNGIKRGS